MGLSSQMARVLKLEEEFGANSPGSLVQAPKQRL